MVEIWAVKIVIYPIEQVLAVFIQNSSFNLLKFVFGVTWVSLNLLNCFYYQHPEIWAAQPGNSHNLFGWRTYQEWNSSLGLQVNKTQSHCSIMNLIKLMKDGSFYSTNFFFLIYIYIYVAYLLNLNHSSIIMKYILNKAISYINS